MRILIILTYYSPYTSGLTLYAVRQANALAARGHQVTVLTSRYEAKFPLKEMLDGVEVIRVPVVAQLNKAAVMPGLLWQAVKLISRADVVNLHLPQMDGAPLAALSRLLGKPVVITYHCDLHLPPGALNRVIDQVSAIANLVAGLFANLIAPTSQDYADNSPFLKRYRKKLRVVDVPVILPQVTGAQVEALRARWGIEPRQPVIGMVGRLAAEKGVEYLIASVPAVLTRYPQARVIFVGNYQNVLGEEAYAQRLAPLIAQLGQHWTFVGRISDEELAAFFKLCDLTVLPSLNSTEGFGMVQIESMISGTPAVGSDLPGVRVPVRITGMGKIVPPGDAKALGAAMVEILDHKDRFVGNISELAHRFSPQTNAENYEDIFRKVITKR